MNEREALEMVEQHALRVPVLVAGDNEARLRRFWRNLAPHLRRDVPLVDRSKRRIGWHLCALRVRADDDGEGRDVA